MRGDSLRDFYAKTLAVLGLGVLAAAGAIVDYWPVDDDPPVVPVVAGRTNAPPALPSAVTVDVPSVARRARAVFRPAPRVLTIATANPTDLFASLPAPDAIALPPMPPPPDTPRADDDAPMPLLFDAIDLPALPADERGDGARHVLRDVVRQTRASLAVARLFLNQAVSGFMGAVRRASPFFSTGVLAVEPY